MPVHIGIPAHWEAEAGELKFGSSLSYVVSSRPGLHSKRPSHNKLIKNKPIKKPGKEEIMSLREDQGRKQTDVQSGNQGSWTLTTFKGIHLSCWWIHNTG